MPRTRPRLPESRSASETISTSSSLVTVGLVPGTHSSTRDLSATTVPYRIGSSVCRTELRPPGICPRTFQKGAFGITLRSDMKPNFRTCPQCSTRNRLDKEFCVKCGEPLEGVKAGDPTAATAPAAKKGKPGIVVLRDGEEGQSPLVPFILVLLTLGVAFGAWRIVQEAEATPDPAQVGGPVRQASVPPRGRGNERALDRGRYTRA